MFKQQSNIKNLMKYSTVANINIFIGNVVLVDLFCKVKKKNKKKFSPNEAVRNIVVFIEIFNIMLFILYVNVYIIG